MLNTPAVKSQLKEAARRWSFERDVHQDVVYKHAMKVLRCIIAGKPLPREPTEDERRGKLVAHRLPLLQGILLAEVETILMAAAEEVLRLAPFYSPQAADLLAGMR